MLPEPPTTPHDEPVVAEQVQLADVIAAGRLSVTVAPVTAFGPPLLATIVYVTVPPGVAVVTPSDFVIERSVAGSTVTLTVEELFNGEGSVTPAGGATLAVFAIVPEGVDVTTVPETV